MNVLSIGGSDPSSGAGIQSDIKTFENHGVYGFTVITAITSQNTEKISKILPIPSKVIKSQLQSVFADFRIDAIKIGMMYDVSIIKAVYSMIKEQKCPIVVDPIIESTTKMILLKKSAVKDYRKMILPLATVVTPNKKEAMILSGYSSIRKAARELQQLGAKNVIITGSRESKNVIEDFILESDKEYVLRGKKINITNHGSGCNYSASLTVSLAKQYTLNQAAKIAKNYVYNSIKNSKNIGRGVRITHTAISNEKMELIQSINDFKRIRNVYKIIPECQTNFVCSKINPKTIRDVLGVSGRLVKSGKQVVTAGEIIYGGSHHVATAVIQVNKKFPNIRSGLNIKFNPKIISKARSCGLTVLTYDRSKEPKKSKQQEGSSIKWGINHALKSKSPDLIYHKGDMGKEPMILIFGEKPNDIIKKISKIT